MARDRIKFWALASFLVAVIVVIAELAAGWAGGEDRPGRDALRRAEMVVVHDRSIPLADLVPDRFERLVVIRGGARAGEIRRAVGFGWGQADALAYHCCDPPPIWAFVQDKNVVAHFRPSLAISYADDVRPGNYAPDDILGISDEVPGSVEITRHR